MLREETIKEGIKILLNDPLRRNFHHVVLSFNFLRPCFFLVFFFFTALQLLVCFSLF